MLYARSLIFYICFYVWSVPVVLSITFFMLGPRRLMIRGVCFWARTSHALLKWTVGLTHEFRGLENLPKGPAILACKHQSAWDTYGFYALDCDPAYVLKKELIQIPFFGWFMLKLKMIVVDRRAGASALKKLLADTRAALDQNRKVIIFPEGTRTAPGRRRGYHPGIAALYQRLDVPVIPVALNSGMYWSRRSLLKRPGVVTVHFLPAMPAGLDRATFLAELRERIETATAALQREAVEKYRVPPPDAISPTP
ncbi:MAG: lysophospholipid acyltransferase family protein [Rhodospirillales bacterium]